MSSVSQGFWCLRDQWRVLGVTQHSLQTQQSELCISHKHFLPPEQVKPHLLRTGRPQKNACNTSWSLIFMENNKEQLFVCFHFFRPYGGKQTGEEEWGQKANINIQIYPEMRSISLWNPHRWWKEMENVSLVLPFDFTLKHSFFTELERNSPRVRFCLAIFFQFSFKLANGKKSLGRSTEAGIMFRCHS